MKKLAQYVPVLGLVTSIALAASVLANSERKSAADVGAPLEPITVVDVQHDKNGTALKINAFFGGCGSGEDFKVDVVAATGGTQNVRITRIKPDSCELYAPNGSTFVVKVKGLDVSKPIVVENPLFVGDT